MFDATAKRPLVSHLAARGEGRREHATDLADKIVIDATNPLNPAMTGLALGFLTSGVELLQSQARQAKFFKTLDRKSTRLNSSHSSISYAVFCLKKKKTRPSTYIRR